MQIRAEDNVPLVFEQFGAEDGIPLVLLHGLSQQRHYWRPVINRLPGRQIVAVDQRGHGDSATDDVDATCDFSIERCATDVMCVLDELGIEEAIVVGHSWGASVALKAAAAYPNRVRSVVLIDGGLFGPRHLVQGELDREQVREALRPPPLGMLEPALWQAISSGDLSPYWTDQIRAALAPTFRTDGTGHTFTRIGMERHMAVLDGLIDYDPAPDIEMLAVPAWVVSCEPRGDDDAEEDSMALAWRRARREQLAALPRTFFVQRWSGALHDVPLQWPAMVAGLLETVAERIEAPLEANKENR